MGFGTAAWEMIVQCIRLTLAVQQVLLTNSTSHNALGEEIDNATMGG